MKVSRLEVFVLGDGPEIDPDKGGVEPLACIRVHTDDGVAGLSEVFRVPPGVVQATVGGSDTHFGRLLIGQEVTHPERLWQRLWDAFLHTNRRGWEIIILGALDVAFWDVYGKMLKRPVWELLGGVQRGPFQTPAGAAVEVTPYCTLVSDVWGGEPMFAQQVARAERLAGLGYRAFKVEPMMSSPRDVVELARRFRKSLGTTPTLMVDVGYLFHDVPTAARVCRELEELDIFFLETPFPVDSPVPYRELARRTAIPLAMGEHGVTRWEFLDMMDRGGVSVVQPYMTTCGGLTEAKRIVELARARGAVVCPGNWSTQILGAATVHLAAYSPITPFIEFAPAEVYDSPLRRELQSAGFPVQGGVIDLPRAPGGPPPPTRPALREHPPEWVPIMPTLSRPTKVRWLIVVLLVGLVFLAHFNRVSISVAANAHFIGPDKLSEEQMGLVYSAFLLVYTLGMLPGGWLIDRIGPRRAMTSMGLGLGFWAALTGVLGWSGMTIAAMFVPLLVIRGLAGATSVPLHPGAARAVSLWVPLRERSTANGLVTAGALVGIAFCYPWFGWLMDRVGWPLALVICGGSLMLFAALWWLLSADDAAGHRATNAAERDLVAAETMTARRNTTLRDVGGLFLNRSLVLLTLSYGAVGYVQYLFFYWVEYYFSKVLKVSPEASRESAFVITMAMAVGMALGGRISDGVCRRLGHRWGCRLMALVGMGLGATFSLLGISTTDPQRITWCFSLALGSLGLCEGIFWTTAPTLEPRNGGLACALVNTGGNGVGMLAPVVTPILGQHFGWTSAIFVACLICGVGGLLWLGIDQASDRPSLARDTI